ncbi:MAG TPA: hypothetical protein VKB68_09095, partial [Stellaceae bacterium]|nr:hypothetical protein [Stellaceae bacterium]
MGVRALVGLRDVRAYAAIAVLSVVMAAWPTGSADASRKTHYAHSAQSGRQGLTSIVIDAETG